MTASVCDVTFRRLRHSPALEQFIEERTNWLQQFAPVPIGLRAVIDAAHRHGHEHPIRVQLRIEVPGEEPITVDREEIGDVYTLVCDTFDIARRRLQDSVREQRGFVKSHSNASRRIL